MNNKTLISISWENCILPPNACYGENGGYDEQEGDHNYDDHSLNCCVDVGLQTGFFKN